MVVTRLSVCELSAFSMLDATVLERNRPSTDTKDLASHARLPTCHAVPWQMSEAPPTTQYMHKYSAFVATTVARFWGALTAMPQRMPVGSPSLQQSSASGQMLWEVSNQVGAVNCGHTRIALVAGFEQWVTKLNATQASR
jgi:hypothetical protein